MILLMYDRKTNWMRLVDKFGHLCKDYSLAYDYKEDEAHKYVEKFIKNYRIYLIDKDGVVLETYD